VAKVQYLNVEAGRIIPYPIILHLTEYIPGN